jgi:D-alanyl-D-alanine carboxypeptidase
MKRQKIILFILITLLFNTVLSTATIANAAQTDSSKDAKWPNGPGVFAESAIIMDASTGLILYEKNIDEAHYPASITKVMTALIALENSNLSDVVTFSRNAVFDVDLDSSRIGIDVGEQLTMQQCLYGLLLESANEVSYAMAEHVGGSVENFAKMMNDKAKSLGCENTNFVNPHGLHDSNHYTTAYDMALITKEAMKNETFRKIFSSRTYQIPPTNIQSETRYLRNHHKFVLKQDYRYDDCIGGKTGYTSISKFTLVSVAKRGDLELVCVVMRDDSSAHQYSDTKELFDFAFDNFSIYPIAELEVSPMLNESPLFTRYNSLLSKEESPIVTDKNGFLILPNDASFEDAKKEVTFFTTSNKSNESLQEGTVVGTISYTYLDKYVGGANILYHQKNTPTLIRREPEIKNPTTAPVDKPTVETGNSLRPIILGAIIGLIVFGLCLYFILVERPRLKRRNAYYRKRARRKLYRDDDYLN